MTSPTRPDRPLSGTMESMRRTIDWDDTDGAVVIVDQCALPDDLRMLRLHTLDDLIAAIQRLAVRGAPALGAAGALGVVMAVREQAGDRVRVRAESERLAAARPTAVNLSWGVRRALGSLADGPDAVLATARAVLDDDERINRQASARAGALVLDLAARRPLRLLTTATPAGLPPWPGAPRSVR